MKFKYFSTAFIFVAPQATAQSVSLEDLQKQIDARVSTLNPYVALPNDPAPARALRWN